MTGCVGEWYAGAVGEKARFVVRAGTLEWGSDGSPETECGCRTTAGRVSVQAVPANVALDEKDVDANGAGAVAGPVGREVKSVGGCAS